MSEVSMKTELKAAADEVWRTIANFREIDRYVSAVATSTMEGSGPGAVRTLTLKDGGEISERLESTDEKTRTLTYSIVDGPLPVEGYLSRMQVRELGSALCELTWSAAFEPKGAPEEEARTVIKGIYAMGFAGLKKLFVD